MNKKFILLKRTYPISKYKRNCDGFKFIIENSDEKKRKMLGLINLKSTIDKNEKYIYQVGKENGKFKTKYISFENFEIIRKYFFGLNDD